MLSSDQSQGSAFFSQGRTLLGRALLLIVTIATGWVTTFKVSCPSLATAWSHRILLQQGVASGETGPGLHGSNFELLMAALGQEQTFWGRAPMSALPPCVDGSELARAFFTY